MTYINPVSDRKRLDAYGRLNYPENYKERLHVSKFERDTFLEGKNSDGSPKATTKVSHYEFFKRLATKSSINENIIWTVIYPKMYNTTSV